MEKEGLGREERVGSKEESKRSAFTKTKEEKKCKLAPLSTGTFLSEMVPYRTIYHLPGTPSSGLAGTQ